MIAMVPHTDPLSSIVLQIVDYSVLRSSKNFRKIVDEIDKKTGANAIRKIITPLRKVGRGLMQLTLLTKSTFPRIMA